MVFISLTKKKCTLLGQVMYSVLDTAAGYKVRRGP